MTDSSSTAVDINVGIKRKKILDYTSVRQKQGFLHVSKKLSIAKGAYIGTPHIHVYTKNAMSVVFPHSVSSSCELSLLYTTVNLKEGNNIDG